MNSLPLLIFFYIFPIIQSACQTCIMTSCNNLEYVFPASGGSCSNANQISLFGNFDNQCNNKSVIARYCAYFETISPINKANNCEQNGTDYSIPWCYDYCEATQACIDPFLINAATKQNTWKNCSQLSLYNTFPCGNVTQDTLDKYLQQSTPTELPQRACASILDSKSLPPGITWHQVELGGLYNLLECPECSDDNLTLPAFQNFSAIKIPFVYREDASFASLFPPPCSKYLGTIQIPAYLIYMVLFFAWALFWLFLYWKRRHLRPLNVRNTPLVAVQIITALFTLWLCSEPLIWGTTASCTMGALIGTALGIPMMMAPLIVRGFRLYYMLRWNRSKVDSNKNDWFFRHRYVIETKFCMLALAGFWAQAFLLTMIVYAVIPYRLTHGTVFESGRCNWFHITPEIQQYAQAKNVVLKPSPTNPTGYVPFSVHFNSCKFCDFPSAAQSVIAMNGTLYLCLTCVVLFLLRSMNDQYWLWRELVVLLVLCLLGIPSVISSVNSDIQMAMSPAPGVFISQLIATFIIFWEIAASCVLPVVLSYIYERKGIKTNSYLGVDSKSPSKSSKSATQLVLDDDNTIRNATLRNVLADPLGQAAITEFAIESFNSENIRYLNQIETYQGITSASEKAKAAVNIWKEFIQLGAPYELNLPYSMKEKYNELFRSFENFKPEEEEERRSPPEEERKSLIWNYVPAVELQTISEEGVGDGQLDQSHLPEPSAQGGSSPSPSSPSSPSSKIVTMFPPSSEKSREALQAAERSVTISEEKEEKLITPVASGDELDNSVASLDMSAHSPLNNGPTTPTSPTSLTSPITSLSEAQSTSPTTATTTASVTVTTNNTSAPTTPAKKPPTTPTSINNVNFKDVTREVEALIGDDWARFKKSQHFTKLVQQIVERQTLGKIDATT